uniref:Fizzy-related protein homolog n=1 Tax=Globodera pallida TaxID=36090 RepID=A0A183C2W1_GLOPA
MNNNNSDEHLRTYFQRPPPSPQKFLTPRGSPQTTPTKYRPDGGDRYIPVRESEHDWAVKYASISKSPLVDASNSTPVRRLFGYNNTNNASTPGHQHQQTNSDGHQQQTSTIPSSSPSSTHSHHHQQNNGGNNNNNGGVGGSMAASSSSSGNNGNSNASPTSSTASNAAVIQSEEISHDSITHRALLTNELLKQTIIDVRSDCDSTDGVQMLQRHTHHSLFKFAHKAPSFVDPSTCTSTLFSTSPLSADSQRLLKSPRKPQRKVPKNPYKVLDAPELQDDFYLNLVDWSSQNMLSVGLNTCVYLWSACNSQVVKLCDLSSETSESVTSVHWSERGDLLAVGTQKGFLQIWDTHAQKMLHNLKIHEMRIGCLAWNENAICSGSRDRFILHRDLRDIQRSEKRMNAHRQEVCGLKWSPNKEYLASGGNDNQLLVWSLRRSEPIQTYTEHNAAVKALAWSPHHPSILVSGGGTADRSLRFWNTMTGQAMQCVETGSQVCNVAWSKHSSELVSTHGYSYNQVILWKYPSMQPITKLSGHQSRVLYLAMSPDGESIVTGAGDETLRFWHVFSKSSNLKTVRSRLNLHSCIR